MEVKNLLIALEGVTVEAGRRWKPGNIIGGENHRGGRV